MEEQAIEEGRRQAQRAIERRQERRRRARAAAPPPGLALPQPPPARMQELGPQRSRVLVAEGDSWFDFPWTDVLKELEDEFGFEVESVSHRGDTIEEMAYSGGQLDELIRLLEKLIRNGRVPEAVLLSGGGNDVAGDEFGVLLNHARSPNPGLNEQVVAGIVEERVRQAYLTVLGEITECCVHFVGGEIPILLHGYDYAIPDGRGFWGGWGPLPGPWLEPGFREKGYEEMPRRRELVRELIDRFNTMLSGLPSAPGLGHVRHVDLRDQLGQGADYREWWSDELHPTEQGFRRVAGEFVQQLP